MTSSIDVLDEVTRVLRLEAQAIQSCSERLRGEPAASQLRKAIDIFQSSLSKGGKLVITGVGKSGKIAQKIAATLSSTGNLAVFLHPTEGLHGDLGIVTPNDAVLALSYTGNTDELVRLIPSLKSLRVPVVGLGGKPASQLALLCDAWIDAAVDVEACPHNLAPTTSTTLALALGDAIAVTLMQLRGFDAQSFARFHPGGSIGRRLTLHVADVMHKGDAVGVVSAAASMDEVVDRMTRKKLGAVVVADSAQMLGIITEGDIRRALLKREKFFDLKAADIMTRQPTVATPQMMAQEALELMENRPSQISVLPVVDERGNWMGVVRLHDLVRTL